MKPNYLARVRGPNYMGGPSSKVPQIIKYKYIKSDNWSGSRPGGRARHPSACGWSIIIEDFPPDSSYESTLLPSIAFLYFHTNGLVHKFP